MTKYYDEDEVDFEDFQRTLEFDEDNGFDYIEYLDLDLKAGIEYGHDGKLISKSLKKEQEQNKKTK